MAFERERAEICHIARSIYARRLTNAAGGNLSMRVAENRYVMTASGLSASKLWEIDTDDVLVVDQDLTVLEGHGRPTREINMHMAMYRTNPRLQAIIHAHPRDLMVYACMGLDMPVVCEALEFLGDSVPCLDYHLATTVELAEAVGAWSGNFGAALNDASFAIEDIYAYGILLRRHGVIVGAESLNGANDLLERLETNAHVHMHMVTLIQHGYQVTR